MSLANIKSNSQGFTIVELLIVVVVIGILAAITIVSYNGITNRANQAAAKASAATIQKKAELFSADSGNNRYPIETDTSFPGTDSSKSWYFSGVTVAWGTTTLVSSDGNSKVRILKCGTGSPANQAAITSANISGLKIFYYDAVAPGETTAPVLVGNTTTCP